MQQAFTAPAPRPAARRSDKGPVIGIILLAVVCVGLIVGHVFMYLALDKRNVALRTLHNTIDTELDQKVRKLGLTPPVKPASDADLIRYDDQFFKQVYSVVERGARYDVMVGKVGVSEDAPIANIETILGAVTPQQPSLARLIQALQGQIADLQAAVKSEEQGRRAAQAARDNADKERDAAQTALRTERQSLLDQMKREVDKQKEQVDQFKQLYDKAQAERREAWSKVDEVQKRGAQEVAKLEEELKRRLDRVQELEEMLKGKKVVEKPGAVAKAATIDFANNFAILDRGARDGIKNGMELVAYRQERGKLALKGRMIVVSTEDEVARADISLQRKDDPIAQGDILYRADLPPLDEDVLAASTKIEEEVKEAAAAKTSRGLKESRRTSYIRLK